MLLSDVKKVTLFYIGGAPSSFLVPAHHVDAFVEASKRLHWKPGKNPHNGAETSKVWRISVADLELRGPYWWTVPDLQNNHDPAGAQIIDGGLERTVFTDEEYVARCNAEEAEAEAAFYRGEEQKARERSSASG